MKNKNSINAEDELMKILSQEISKSIDLEIGNNLKNYVLSKSWKRKNSIDKLYPKIKDVE
jgi:hypothetical protein